MVGQGDLPDGFAAGLVDRIETHARRHEGVGVVGDERIGHLVRLANQAGPHHAAGLGVEGGHSSARRLDKHRQLVGGDVPDLIAGGIHDGAVPTRHASARNGRALRCRESSLDGTEPTWGAAASRIRPVATIDEQRECMTVSGGDAQMAEGLAAGGKRTDGPIVAGAGPPQTSAFRGRFAFHAHKQDADWRVPQKR